MQRRPAPAAQPAAPTAAAVAASGVWPNPWSQLSFPQMRAGYRDAGPFLLQDAAVLFLTLAVLKTAFLRALCWCPLKGVSVLLGTVCSEQGGCFHPKE